VIEFFDMGAPFKICGKASRTRGLNG
jgi:hypothetical protein